MVSETSVMPAATESKMAASSDMPRCPNTYELENEYQDFPKSTEDMPAEEYHELIKKYFKLKGLRHFEDFNEKEQEAIVEDCIINLNGPKVLSKKYNTMAYVIRQFVQARKMKITPDDLSRYPDYPRKPDDMSLDDYQKVIRKYWNSRQNKRQKEKQKEKRKAAKGLDDSENGSNNSTHPSHLMDDIDNYPDYPLRTDDMSIWDHQEAIKKYFQLKGLKHNDDYSEDEKNAIIEDCTVNMIGPKALSQKYNTMVYVIRTLVTSKGWKVTPDDLSKYPNYPKKSDDMSQEEYQAILRKYHEKAKKDRQKDRYKEKRREKKKVAEECSGEINPSTRQFDISSTHPSHLKDDIDDYPDYPLRTEGMSILEYQEEIRKYFQLKNLKHNDDFSEEEKNAIIEDCTVNMIGPIGKSND